MTTLSQLEIVRREIADIKAEMLTTQNVLAATQNKTDVDFLHKKLERLHEEKIICRKQETILLQGQASVLGKVVFGVTAKQGEFPDFEFELSTTDNEVLLEDVEKRLGWHNPPLRLKTVNNVLATARPSNKTLAANFKDGDRLELVADIAPGHAYFDAYPRPFEGFRKGLPWSWIHQ
ncbi:TPA: hypothetical protein ACH3X1_009626 [Trebouxia sp. C0004]